MCTLGLGPGSCALYDQLRECCLTWWERPLIMVITARECLWCSSQLYTNNKNVNTHLLPPARAGTLMSPVVIIAWQLSSCECLLCIGHVIRLMTPCHAVSRVLMTHVTLQTPARCYQAKPAPASPASRMCQCPGLWLVNISHETSILASDWSDWPQTWPLIGWWPHSIKCMLSSKVSLAAWCCCKPKCRHEHSLSPAKSLSL